MSVAVRGKKSQRENLSRPDDGKILGQCRQHSAASVMNIEPEYVLCHGKDQSDLGYTDKNSALKIQKAVSAYFIKWTETAFRIYRQNCSE